MTQRTKLLAATAALLAILGAVTWQALQPRDPANPLAEVSPEDILSVAFPPAPPAPERQAALVQAVVALKDAPRRPAEGINWAAARYVRVELDDGIVLSLQHMDGLVRVVADAPQQAGEKVRARAEAFRTLRGEAFSVDAATARAFDS